MEQADARKLHDDLLALKPEGASHNADICSFCVEAAQDATTSRIPPADGGPDDDHHRKTPTNTEGGAEHSMSDTMTMETHEALLAKAVSDAVASTEQALAAKTDEAKTAGARVTELETENGTLKEDNARLNGELDTAQVGVKAANDRVTELEGEIETTKREIALRETASKRAEQVKNLKLYDDEYVAERAESWAKLADEDWASRLDEWAKLKTPAASDGKSTDAASAMSGTNGTLTQDPPPADSAGDQADRPSPRRAALGLVS